MGLDNRSRAQWREGGDPGFWDRLGYDEGMMPAHLPMGVNERGQGPENDADAYTYVCWCGDPECPLTLALGHAWRSGRRSIPPAQPDRP